MVSMSGLKRDLEEILTGLAEECPGLPIAVVGPGAGTAELIMMIQSRVVVDYTKDHDLEALRETLGRLEAERHRAPVGGAAAPPELQGTPIERMVNAINDGTFHLPALGDTMTKLREVGDSENAHIGDVEAVVGTDPALVGAVLKEANSSLMGGSNAVTSLRAACMRLGIPRVLGLAREALLASVLPTTGDVAAIAMASWDRALLARKIAVLLADDVGLSAPDVDDAMLLHDVGELALLKVLSEVLGAKSLNSEETTQAEGILGKNHEAVGAMILKSWSMPMELVRLASCHHGQAPRWPESRPQATLRTLVHICDQAAMWTLGEQDDGPDAALLGAVGISQDRLIAVSSRAMQDLQRAA